MENKAARSRELAVVVGATGALGGAIVKRLIGAGLDILAVGRSEADLAALADSDPAIGYCVADMADDAAIDVVRANVRRTVRMAVHAPGVPVAGGVLEAPTEALVAAVNIKVGGMLRLARAVDERLVPHSRLVAIGGHYGFEPTAYAAGPGVANAALANLMRQLSWAMGPRGITAHLVAPGPADTERLRKVVAARAAQRGVAVDEALDELRRESAIGAFTTPEQVAWAIALLVEPEADALAGASLMLDAGRRHGLP